jgi:hypothetical protein
VASGYCCWYGCNCRRELIFLRLLCWTRLINVIEISVDRVASYSFFDVGREGKREKSLLLPLPQFSPLAITSTYVTTTIQAKSRTSPAFCLLMDVRLRSIVVRIGFKRSIQTNPLNPKLGSFAFDVQK